MQKMNLEILYVGLFHYGRELKCNGYERSPMRRAEWHIDRKKKLFYNTTFAIFPEASHHDWEIVTGYG